MQNTSFAPTNVLCYTDSVLHDDKLIGLISNGFNKPFRILPVPDAHIEEVAV